MNNIRYQDLLNIEYKISKIKLVIILIFIILIFISYIIKSYNVYNIKGIYDNNLVNINLPTKDSDIIRKSKFILLNESKYQYDIINYSEIIFDGYQEYQIVTLKINMDFKNNEIINLKFYYSYERIIEKIIKIFL